MEREARNKADLITAYAEARQALEKLAALRMEFDFPRNDVEYICSALNSLDAMAQSWSQQSKVS